MTSAGSVESFPELAPVEVRATCSPRASSAAATPVSADNPTAEAARKVAIAVDLSDESAYTVKWAADHYLRPGDSVVLLHVRPLGSVNSSATAAATSQAAANGEKLDDHTDVLTTSKATELAQPLIDAKVPCKIHIVKDHEMKERLCLEVERLGLSAVIMGSRGFGATRRGSNDKLGSISNYCVNHCVCPVVVVRHLDERAGNSVSQAIVTVTEAEEEGVAEED